MNFFKPSFETLSQKEWLVTNGLGGYASSSISGANTRRYHGLLVAALRPPTDRIVMVSKVEETVVDIKGNHLQLSSNQYSDVIHPGGYEIISSFDRNPLPLTTFQGAGWMLSKMVFMVHHSNTTVIEYQNLGAKQCKLVINPFYVYKDYHMLFHQQDTFDFYREEAENFISIIYPRYGAAPLFVQCPDSEFASDNVWNKNIFYAKEAERGLNDLEHTCSIGSYSIALEPGQKAHLLFTIEKDQLNPSWNELKEQEIKRIRLLTNDISDVSISGLSKQDAQFYKDLITAGEQFIVKRESNNGQSIIAGYHWFTDWGRDTMIAMRGLVIARGKQELAKNIINTFLAYLKDGLIPNRFPDQGEMPEYNTIDASLWVFIVLYEYHQKFNDVDFIGVCLPKLNEILCAYRDGTHFKIHMLEEGLIFGGEGLSQLTWMDAKVGDYVVTPRQGCPVEINVLWYNAICIFNEFQNLLAIADGGWKDLAPKVKEAFRLYFLNSHGYLNDVVVPGEYADDAIRPNQVYALSLPFTLLSDTENQNILNCITNKLLTPYGLRSLSMDHPDFIGLYGGDQWHRDKAYHQGTVWTFLMGEYFLAYLKINKYSREAKQYVVSQMATLKHHFYHEDCIQGISEVFDGENPGRGRGCIQQAWSVGMLLLVLEKVMGRQSSVVNRESLSSES